MRGQWRGTFQGTNSGEIIVEVDDLDTLLKDLAPDLAVEVISPNDLASEVNEKIDEYLSAGVSLVWVIDPDSKTVSVYRKDGSTARLRESDELSGEDVIPGFSCKVNDIFADVMPPDE